MEIASLRDRLNGLTLDDVLDDVVSSCLLSEASPDAGRLAGIFELLVPGGAFCGPLFGIPFSKLLVEYAVAFEAASDDHVVANEGAPIADLHQPNGQNAYGFVLSEIGLAPLAATLAPLCARLSPLLAPDDHLPSDPPLIPDTVDSHAYIIRYKEGEDRHLATHQDDSDLTINACLYASADCVGGNLYFSGSEASDDRLASHTHSAGAAVVQRGEVWHGVDPFESGERWNLVLWAFLAGPGGGGDDTDDDPEAGWKRGFYRDMIDTLPRSMAATPSPDQAG